MAGQGPPPKDPAKRRRRNADTKAPTTKVSRDGRMRGPALPKGVLPDDETWHARTVAWWATWRKSPQAKEFTATDWDFLLDTALMHHTMWTKGKWDFAAELRLRVGKFGATLEDRLRLRMAIEPPQPAGKPVAQTPPGVTDIRSRRKRLTA